MEVIKITYNGINMVINIIDDNHASIRREDKQPFNPTWKQMQGLKDLAFGRHACAVEVFPSCLDVVDNNNHRHLWVVDRKSVPNLKSKKDGK